MPIDSAKGQLLEAPDGTGDILQPVPADDSPTPDSFRERLERRQPSLQVDPQPHGWVTPDGPYQDTVSARSPRFHPPYGEPPQTLSDPGSGVGGRLWGLFGTPTGRHRGIGQPLLCESWRYRPFSAGWFMGMVQGGPLIDDWVGGNQGFLGGYRLGWDYDHYWGCETRLSFGNVALCDSQRAQDAQQAADDATGLGRSDPFRRRFDRRRDCTIGLWDVSLVHYPWGDAAWRPYLAAGLGAARIDFIDRLSTRHAETVFAVPVAMGVKYRYGDWTALRLECADNVTFGNGLNMVQHLSLTGGVEVRFGGSRVAYWPWHPGRHYW